MPTGVYERKPCPVGCACGKHRPRQFSAATRRRISEAARRRGANHVAGCSCGWCRQRDWRSDDPTYRAVHARLVRERGAPRLCVSCGSTTAKWYDWAYTGPGHEQECGQPQPYSEDLSLYVRLCRSCHRRYDRGLISVVRHGN